MSKTPNNSFMKHARNNASKKFYFSSINVGNFGKFGMTKKSHCKNHFISKNVFCK